MEQWRDNKRQKRYSSNGASAGLLLSPQKQAGGSWPLPQASLGFIERINLLGFSLPVNHITPCTLEAFLKAQTVFFFFTSLSLSWAFKSDWDFMGKFWHFCWGLRKGKYLLGTVVIKNKCLFKLWMLWLCLTPVQRDTLFILTSS